MEFNVLPRAKILSPHSSNNSKQTTNQTVNVILPQQSNDAGSKPKIIENQTTDNVPPALPSEEIEANPYANLEPGTVNYQTRDVNLNEPADQLTKADSIATINFLKLVLEAYMHNPIRYNGYVICTVPVLENMIETLTSCDDCSIDFSDFETSCCGSSTNKIVPVTKVWVRNGETSELFKYKYGQFLKTFEDYHISLKFVYIRQ